MTVIRTGRNLVCAPKPDPNDKFVRTVWHGPHADGRHLVPFSTGPMPIALRQEAIDWAVGIADQMCNPLYIVPMRVADAVANEIERFTGRAELDFDELWQIAVEQVVETMRDSNNVKVRLEAFEVLVRLGVLGSGQKHRSNAFGQGN